MSRRKSKESTSGFAKLLFSTLVLSTVFSIGLITGQRILLHESLPPLVSIPQDIPNIPTLSASTRTISRVEAAPSVKDAEADSTQADTAPSLTFYEQLARPRERIRRKQAPPPKQARPPIIQRREEQPVPAEKPAEPIDPIEKVATKPTPNTVDEKVEEKVEEESARDEQAEDINTPSKPLPARYTLQIGAHPTLESARNEMDRLRKIGHEPHVISAEVPGQGTFYRVRIGKFHSMDEARNYQADLKQRASLDTFVTPL